MGHPHDGIPLTIHFGRQSEHVARTRSHTNSATLTPFVVDDDRTFDFCHNVLIDIFQDKYRIFSEEKQTFSTIPKRLFLPKIRKKYRPTVFEKPQ